MPNTTKRLPVYNYFIFNRIQRPWRRHGRKLKRNFGLNRYKNCVDTRCHLINGPGQPIDSGQAPATQITRKPTLQITPLRPRLGKFEKGFAQPPKVHPLAATGHQSIIKYAPVRRWPFHAPTLTSANSPADSATNFAGPNPGSHIIAGVVPILCRYTWARRTDSIGSD